MFLERVPQLLVTWERSLDFDPCSRSGRRVAEMNGGAMARKEIDSQDDVIGVPWRWRHSYELEVGRSEKLVVEPQGNIVNRFHDRDGASFHVLVRPFVCGRFLRGCAQIPHGMTHVGFP